MHPEPSIAQQFENLLMALAEERNQGGRERGYYVALTIVELETAYALWTAFAAPTPAIKPLVNWNK